MWSGIRNMISVVLPVYNEEEGIKEIVNNIKDVMDSYKCEIIAVDDGSKDNSGKILDGIDGIKVIHNPYNLGYGASIKTGIRAAKGDWILIVDSDGTYPVKAIPELIHYTKEYDMVVGARTKKNVKVPLLRRPAKLFLGALANFLTGRKIADFNSGLRIFKKDIAIEFFHLFPSGFSFTTTLTLACLTNDYTVKYVPIDYYKRKGASTINPLKDFIGFTALIFRIVTYFRPFRMFSSIAFALFLIALLVFFYSMFVLGRVMDIATIVIALSSLQVFLFGLLAELVVKRK